MVTEKEVSFKRLEERIYRIVCSAGCNLMRSMLEDLDARLMKDRNRSTHRHKGTRKTTIKTLMGEVEYERAVYEVKGDGVGQKYVYLLDKALQKETIGLMSAALAEHVVLNCCEMPYRQAAEAVSAMTGQRISHTAAWAVLQEVGNRAGQREKEASHRAHVGEGRGEYESKLLFEEQDGVWLKMQGKDRKKHGASKEMKMMVAYDGAKKMGKKRYELQNKVAYCGFEKADKFFERKEGAIADYYALDEIEQRILNGDGASWIRRSTEGEGIHFQLDPYHRNKAILIKVWRPEARREIWKLLYEKKTAEMLEYIGILADSVTNADEQKDLRELHQYLSNNADGLVGYHRRGLKLPEPKAGMVYRRLGAMESNVFSLIGRRMKGRRAAWSIRGGGNLGRLLCLKTTKRLKSVLCSVMGCGLPERYVEEITKPLKASQVEKSIGKGYDGFTKAMIPATTDFRWLKGMMVSNPFSELTYR